MSLLAIPAFILMSTFLTLMGLGIFVLAILFLRKLETIALVIQALLELFISSNPGSKNSDRARKASKFVAGCFTVTFIVIAVGAFITLVVLSQD